MKKLFKVTTVISLCFLLFIETSMKTVTVFASSKNLSPIIISDSNELQAYIDYNGKFTSQYALKKSSITKKVTVTESGILILHSFSTEKKSTISIYSNLSQISCISSKKIIPEVGAKITVFIDPGTYYINMNNPTSTQDVVTSYVGFIPSSSTIDVNSITLDKNKAYANVKFNLNVNAYDEIRVMKGDVLYTDIKNSAAWETNSNENLVTNLKFKATSNGEYTARLIYNNGLNATTLHFEVTGLKDTRPSIPKISTCTIGSKLISGVALKYSTVYVQIGTSKYFSKAKSNGIYTIQTCKLQKGMKLKSWIVSSTGIKSHNTCKIIK